MLKVLILAYHFTPSNSSAAHRPESWIKYGKKFGFFPTLVTRHWQGLENDWLDFASASGTEVNCETTEEYEIIRLPYKNSLLKKYSFLKRYRLFRKLYFFSKILQGKFHTQANIEETFTASLVQMLKVRSFDLIIATAPPYQLIEVAKNISVLYGIPYVADIRDLWNDNLALKNNHEWRAKERFNELVSRYYIFKWLKKASLIIAVSEPLGKIISEKIKVPVLEVTNGYDSFLYQNISVDMPEVFTITLTGTIYPEQNFDILLNGFKQFLSINKRAKINFIGISLFPEVEQKVRKILPDHYINILPRIPKAEAIHYTSSSHVLFYAGWLGYKGFYSGKIFEYLAARRNILIAPGDGDVMDSLINKTKAGAIANTSEEVAAILDSWYSEWIEYGYIKYVGIEMEVQKYSREEQTKKMASAIKNLIKK